MTGTDPITAVAEAAGRYYRAMVAGDPTELRRLFDPRAVIAGHDQGELLWMDLESFVAEAQGLVGQHGPETCTVEGLRVDGDIATVSVRGRYAGQWFLDHLSLVEVEGCWTIIAKSFRVVA